MAETKKAPSNIILGSGYIYYQDFNGETVPDVDTICTEANVLGYIQGGATLSYKPTFYTASDDDGTHQKTIITEEEATLKLALWYSTATRLTFSAILQGLQKIPARNVELSRLAV